MNAISKRQVLKMLGRGACAAAAGAASSTSVASVASVMGLWPTRVLAQQHLAIPVQKACFYTELPLANDVYGFAPSDAAVSVVKAICGKVGLPPNFTIMTANVPNAAAVIDGDKRYILYSEMFMAEATKVTRTQWSGLSILAHEVGHHLSGHTLSSTAHHQRRQQELEADTFSGFIVAAMGGDLPQATAAMKKYGGPGSDNYPPKSARLEAIAVGWRQAAQRQTAAPPPSVGLGSGSEAQHNGTLENGGQSLFQ